MTDKTGREAEHVEKSPAGVVDPKDAAVPAEHPAPAGARGRIVRDGSDLPRLKRAERIDSLARAFGIEPIRY